MLLPQLSMQLTSSERVSELKLHTENVKILLIDDQAIFGEAISRMIANETDITFNYLSEPSAALQNAIALEPTVILLDLIMPEIDGLMLLRWFRSHQSTREIPIVMLSSKEEPILKAEAFAAGANDYLIKLPDAIELIARIRYHSKAYNNLKALSTATATAKLQAQELETTLHKLQTTQVQLIQTEKMSSLGRMVGGLAHEINNPISFIHGNFHYLHEHIHTLLKLIELYQKEYPEAQKFMEDEVGDIDLDFIIEDFQKILSSMRIGTDRIKEIVLSLRNFSRLDQAEKKAVNIHDGIESTLFLLNHRLKQEIEIIKDYGKLPLVECYPAQLNQVFLNIINNAIDDLLYNKKSEAQKQIIIKTEITEAQTIKVSIIDNGSGIEPEIHSKIFDPFFTTKPINKGTGLGLAISYQIIESHHGSISVNSQPGDGAEFIIEIPISINS
ncbi:sensor histidine kinase [Nostoc cycadae]|uniref:histidine kinase n=1 Tax=Nostoc cycadae WK-1 TaxID=1861711 RepID=A0A2H6LCY1_9NOSO|nr:ATP-binding protein [Nostoc cycadae]GBE91085.1 two-component sensor histidine kinase [Nostoc cycadae WK-1]